jgi:hypothetical protein
MRRYVRKTEPHAANSTYPQVAVKWLIEGTCFYSPLVQVGQLSTSKSPPAGSCIPLGAIVWFVFNCFSAIFLSFSFLVF